MPALRTGSPKGNQPGPSPCRSPGGSKERAEGRPLPPPPSPHAVSGCRGADMPFRQRGCGSGQPPRKPQNTLVPPPSLPCHPGHHHPPSACPPQCCALGSTRKGLLSPLWSEVQTHGSEQASGWHWGVPCSIIIKATVKASPSTTHTVPSLPWTSSTTRPRRAGTGPPGPGWTWSGVVTQGLACEVGVGLRTHPSAG